VVEIGRIFNFNFQISAKFFFFFGKKSNKEFLKKGKWGYVEHGAK
jgi:hypothetical protein